MKTVIPLTLKKPNTDWVIGQYFLRIWPENEYVINVEAFKVTGECTSEKGITFDPPKPFFERKGAIHSGDTTYDLDEAQRIVSGHIKWDGCSDLTFYPDEAGYQHFCGRNSAKQLGEVVAALYDAAWDILSKITTDRDLYEGN